jgi:hypothetical protein
MHKNGIDGWSRREVLGGLALTGAAAMVGLRPHLSAAAKEPPPETTTLQLRQWKPACWVPFYVAEPLLRAHAFSGKLTDNGDGTVSDKSEGLMWQQAEGGLQKWQAGMTYCDNLSLGGHDDWKLPTIDQLRSMVDNDFSQPMVDTTFFPDFPPTQIFYWSSTEPEKNKRQAKVLIFNYGSDDDMFKNEKYYVRCVRAEK